jgi:hypothetical protein
MTQWFNENLGAFIFFILVGIAFGIERMTRILSSILTTLRSQQPHQPRDFGEFDD